MSRAATRQTLMTVEEVAGMLFDRGVGLNAVATDQGLAEQIAKVVLSRHLRLGDVPNDFQAIRAELTCMAFEAERVGRSALCGRYTPDSMKQRVQ